MRAPDRSFREVDVNVQLPAESGRLSEARLDARWLRFHRIRRRTSRQVFPARRHRHPHLGGQQGIGADGERIAIQYREIS